MAEIWADIKGYEGLYKVSQSGLIKSCDRVVEFINGVTRFYKSQIIKGVIQKKTGYIHVGLCNKNGINKTFRLHRIVALAFIPNPKNLPQINHKDYNKANNSVSNLEWCDSKYQNQHAAKKQGRRWKRHNIGQKGIKHPLSKSVTVFDLNNKLIGSYESGGLAALATNSQQDKISLCCLGKRKSHNKLKFQFTK